MSVRPADFLEEARDRFAQGRRDTDDQAWLDQRQAAADEALAKVSSVMPFEGRFDRRDPEALAFQRAVQAALFERVEAGAVMVCDHIDFGGEPPAVPCFADLSQPFVVCRDCAPGLLSLNAPVWKPGQCDLCETECATFRQLSATLFSLAVNMNLCPECAGFVGVPA